MGVVYKAQQVSLKRLVAVKMILAGRLADEQESSGSASRPKPPPIWTIRASFASSRSASTRGGTTSRWISSRARAWMRLKQSPLPPREAAQLMEQVARAVAYAHSRGVIHRDLKPANILVDRQNQPRVTDFGLAKRMQDDRGLTATGSVLGRPATCRRSRRRGGQGQIAERSDVYSLGATLYALLVGRPPFQAATPMETLLQVIEQEPLPLRQLNPALPRDLETICARRRRTAAAVRVGG